MYVEIQDLKLTDFLDSDGELNSEMLCQTIQNNKLQVTNYALSTEIERNKEYYDLMHQQKILLESFIPDGTSEKEIIEIFIDELKPLELERNKLTIVDPYIFANGTEISLLSEILLKCVICKDICFITNCNSEKYCVRKNIEDFLNENGFKFTVKYDSSIHDRYWLSNKSGIICGTSFGGIGKKKSLIMKLDDKNYYDIAKVFLSENQETVL